MKLRRYDMIGQRRRTVWGDSCVYCGERATTREHFPPISLSKIGVILPACMECNTLAGTSYASDFAERVRHVQECIRQRYVKAINTPIWSDNEVDELGYVLQSGVRQWNALIKTVRKRIAWNAERYLSNIDPISCSVLLHAGLDITTAIENENLWSYDVSFEKLDNTILKYRKRRKSDASKDWR